MNIFKIIFLLPGTIIHEFWHFFIGLILNAKPVDFTIIPKRNENGGLVLGSVGFKNINFFNALPTALAPLLSIVIIFFFFKDIISVEYLINFNNNTYKDYIIIYIIYIAIISSIPSTTDFKVLFSYPVGVLFYLSIFIGFLYFYNPELIKFLIDFIQKK